MIKVLLADDHPLFRAGLSALIAETPGLELAGEAGDGPSAVEAAVALRPDVVVMDLNMPGLSGVDATRHIMADRPETAVLVLTMMDDDNSVLAAMRAGARGYVLKGAGSAEIVRSVEAVAAGDVVFGAPLARRMISLFEPRVQRSNQPFPELTPREHDILEHIARGLDNSAIADRLGLSVKTVRNNVSAVFVKLRVTDRAAAVARARDAGL